MAKTQKNTETNTTVAVLENPMDTFGPVVPTPSSNKKETTRDYVKTPEVNKILADHPTKSAAIRALHTSGVSRGQIADTLRIRYQHVNNVLNQKLKKTS